MRLLVAAVMVVATFVVVVLLISHLFPNGAGWAGVCVAMTCLYARKAERNRATESPERQSSLFRSGNGRGHNSYGCGDS